MKKIISIVYVLVLSAALNAQSAVTGVQYLGAAASANAAKKQQTLAKGQEAKTKVAFQMDIELSGRAHWGVIPTSYLGQSPHDGGISFLYLGGNRTITGGPGANIDLGIRVDNSYFIGVGAQFEANFGKTKASVGTRGEFGVQVMNLCLPIYGIFKVYVPSSTGVNPYFDLGIGGYLPDWYQLKSPELVKYGSEIRIAGDAQIEGDKLFYQAEKGGFYLHAAAGVDINCFQVSAGYELSTASGTNFDTRLYHNVFLKMGFRIGG